MKRRGNLFVICGPSGVGKGTVINGVFSRLDNIVFSISATTRQPREGEKDGVQYFFLSEEDFKARIERNEFLEWSYHFENYYGTLKSFVNDSLSQGIDVVLDIDVKGTLELIASKVEAIYVFVLPPSMEELKKRLINRKTESLEKIEERLGRAKWEISNISHYDYVIINDDLNDSIDELQSVIKASRCKLSNIDLDYLNI